MPTPFEASASDILMSWQTELHQFDPKTRNKPGLTGLVFDIQRFALHDGDGIRTLVFLKGCPLHCTWCANPESMCAEPELWNIKHRCIGCSLCVNNCPSKALTLTDDGIQVDRDACTTCGSCVKTCYSGSINVVGRYLTVDELYTEINRDRAFFDTSGGGVTFSGGEPTQQADFLRAMLIKCQENGLTTAIETCGITNWQTMSSLLEHLDLVLIDLKHMDTEIHKQHTGGGNEGILENIRKLDEAGMPHRIRMPLVPGINDSEENIQATADFICTLKHMERFDLLPYHRLGEPKWEQIDKTYALHGVKPPEIEEVNRVAEIFRQRGIKISIGGI